MPRPETPSRPAIRGAWGLAALGVVVLVPGLAWKVYRGQQGDDLASWILGPPARELERAAEAHVIQGLDLLNDPERAPRDRVEAYRAELAAAEHDLRRSLRGRPAQARALARLAAIDFELDPPATAEDSERILERVAVASRMAPGDPRVQVQLGEVLVRMGRRDEGLAYFARAIELDPRVSREAVGFLRRNLFSAGELLEALPPRSRLLVELRAPSLEDGEGTRYLEIVEEALADPDSLHRGLVSHYGSACLQLGQAARLAEYLDRVGPYDDGELDAERLRQRSRAALGVGNLDEALHLAREARQRDPESVGAAEHLGDASLAAGRVDEALRAYDATLGLVARSSANPQIRARLYRKRGQSEERRGDVGRAYDAYKMALELDPDEAFARARLEAMERAAGP